MTLPAVVPTGTTVYVSEGYIDTDWSYHTDYTGEMHYFTRLHKALDRVDSRVNTQCRTIWMRDKTSQIKVTTAFHLNCFVTVIVKDDIPVYFYKVAMNLRIGHPILSFLEACESGRMTTVTNPYWRYFAIELFIRHFRKGVHHNPIAVEATRLYPLGLCHNPECRHSVADDNIGGDFHIPDVEYFTDVMICMECGHTSVEELIDDTYVSTIFDDFFDGNPTSSLRPSAIELCRDNMGSHYTVVRHDERWERYLSRSEARNKAMGHILDDKHDMVILRANFENSGKHAVFTQREIEVCRVSELDLIAWVECTIEGFAESERYESFIDEPVGSDWIYTPTSDNDLIDAVEMMTWLDD